MDTIEYKNEQLLKDIQKQKSKTVFFTILGVVGGGLGGYGLGSVLK